MNYETNYKHAYRLFATSLFLLAQAHTSQAIDWNVKKQLSSIADGISTVASDAWDSIQIKYAQGKELVGSTAQGFVNAFNYLSEAASDKYTELVKTVAKTAYGKQAIQALGATSGALGVVGGALGLSNILKLSSLLSEKVSFEVNPGSLNASELAAVIAKVNTDIKEVENSLLGGSYLSFATPVFAGVGLALLLYKFASDISEQVAEDIKLKKVNAKEATAASKEALAAIKLADQLLEEAESALGKSINQTATLLDIHKTGAEHEEHEEHEIRG